MAKQVKFSSVGGCKLKAMTNFEGCCQQMRAKIQEHEGNGGDWEVVSEVTDNNARSISLVLLPLPQKKEESK